MNRFALVLSILFIAAVSQANDGYEGQPELSFRCYSPENRNFSITVDLYGVQEPMAGLFRYQGPMTLPDSPKKVPMKVDRFHGEGVIFAGKSTDLDREYELESPNIDLFYAPEKKTPATLRWISHGVRSSIELVCKRTDF